LRNLGGRDLGFARDHILFAWTQPSGTGASPTQLRELWNRVLDRVSEVPGVVSASASNGPLLNGVVPPQRVVDLMTVPGQPPKPTTRASWRTFVAPRYFETMEIPLIAG